MTEETSERTGDSQASKIEIEEKISSNLSPCEDLGKVDGDCNGIVHDCVEAIDGYVKEDGDGSCVFVGGRDAVSDDLVEKDLDVDAECVVDPGKTIETVPAVEGEIVSEPNVDSQSGEKQVEVGELSIDKVGHDQFPVENGCNIDESVVSSSSNGAALESSHSQPKGSEAEKNDPADEQNKTALAPDIEGNQESIVTTIEATESEVTLLDRDEVKENVTVPLAEIESYEAGVSQQSTTVKKDVECELQQPDNDEKKTVLGPDVEGNQESEITTTEAAELEVPLLDRDEVKDNVTQSNEVERSLESTKVKEDVECELQLLDNEEKVMEFDGVKETEEQSKPDSATEVKENQESENMVKDSSESKRHQLQDGEKEGGEPRTLDLAIREENQESQVTDMKDVELELGQLDNREVTDTEDDPSGGIRLEASTSPVTTQLEAEALDGSIESGTSLPSGPVASETEVINDLGLGNGNMMYTVDIKQESENVDGPVENPASLPHLVDEVVQETELGNISVKGGESFPSEQVDNMICEAEVRNPCVEISESLPLEGSNNVETVVANGSIDGVESRHTCIAGNGKSENEICNGSVEGDIAIPTCPAENLEIQSEAMNGSTANARSLPSCSVVGVEVESEGLNCSIKNGSSMPTCHVADVEQEPEAGNESGASENAPSGDVVNIGAIVQDGSVQNGGTAAHSINDVIDVENEGTQSTSGGGDGKPICQEVDTEGIQRDEGLQSSPGTEGSTDNVVDEPKVDTEVVKNPYHFLIKIPRYVDDKHKEQIRLAQLQVEEKTQSRDAMRATIQMKRVTCNEYRDKFEAARSEERTARDAFSAKRQEIDSVQSAISIDDIEDRINNMEHRIQHETMPLKEEKQLIREIKQIKILREQLSSHMGRQDEHQQASDQRDNHGERFKLLKQELDSLRKKVSQTEGITKAAKEKYFEENEKLRKLQSQFKAADDLRQEAYAHLQNLRKTFYEKNHYFRKYKDEQRVANDYASSGDREALQHLCNNQVETVMEQWNKNDEFRKEYIRLNTMSTLRRLTTLDGRSLGPDEEPPVIRLVDERVDNVLPASSQIDSALVVSPSEPVKSFVLRGAEKGDVKSVVRVQQENATAKSKKASKPTALENGSATSSGREEKDEVEEENKKSKEEEELVRKAEELRKEEAAARLKEQRRLEEKVKAKEAEERKKRNAEKAQARAELRAQREAELKEKEREKRAKKKERKKAAGAVDVSTEGESAPTTENASSDTTAPKSEIKEKTLPVVNRPQKPSTLAKQSKTKPLPPPLRNRSKRRMQTWMWFLIATLLVLALFFLGSIGFSFKFGLPSIGI
ncbi:uncharacterized protein LOC122073644 [Macadamia integrifolia]|uniref:uncharacterized protein LOC122073644 n=1 Tax=Macadamia integrifolia TaxID=60698 RepID=UPI001C4F6377|nr:uncharacterized protein LOC122073644 [Macadamia integrifolia]XP_042494200.1 uncharacterized protein LOC122073644 [Macadamia integrifolia]